MSTVEDDGFSRARLGKFEHPAEARVKEAAPVFEHLSTRGLTAPRRGLCNAIAVALVHSSYLYEHRQTLRAITPASLEAVSRLGDAYLTKTAAVACYGSTVNPRPGVLSKEVGGITVGFADWALSQKWLRDSAGLSDGLDRENLPPKVAATLHRQVIGVLCLEGEEEVAQRLLMDYVVYRRQEMESSVNDPKTVLGEALGYDAVAYEYEREGPDHAVVFRARAMDRRGRSGQGIGRSKKSAAQQAALDFLRRHVPQVFNSRSTTLAQPRPPQEIRASAGHIEAVRRVQTLFSLPHTSRPLISQALVHSSWAYENHSLMARSCQQDYQVLAYLGSQVLVYEYILASTRRVAVNPSDGRGFSTLPNDSYDSAFRQVGLASGLLLGTGQKSQGIAMEIGADAFQAVIGAVSAASNFQGTLADRWPPEWAEEWQLVAPTAPRPVDSTTRLQRVVSAMKLHMTYEFRSSGPEHARRFTAVAVLDSGALGTRFKVPGAAAAGKGPAKHNASLAVLSVLDRLADGAPARSFNGADERDRALAQFLLAQQAFVLDIGPIQTQRWVDARLFGFHLASDESALLKWATGVDEFLGLDLPLQPGSCLKDGFRKAIQEGIDTGHTLDTALARFMEILEQVEEPADLTHSHVQELVQLCDVFRCLGADDPDSSLPDLVDDWRILHRSRLKTMSHPPSVQLSGRERAVLDAVLSSLRVREGRISVECLGIRPLHLSFRSTQPPSRIDIDAVCGLWSKVSRNVRLTAGEQGIDVIITTPDVPAESGPITTAVLAALRPRPEPYRAAVADLLHDLKNQLVAARLAESQPAEGRTAWLQQQLSASRHLDEAHALAVRLREATSMLASVDPENVELGGFLRRYAIAVATRLPSTISMPIPESRSAIYVAVGARTLTAALDNLIGNAIEALPNGGAISLEWTADEYEAVIEIGDDGPGLPPDVVAALNAGERLSSTKVGGNGLGLLGVRSFLARVGGQLSPVATPQGTTWLITLPVATPTTEEPECTSN